MNAKEIFMGYKPALTKVYSPTAYQRGSPLISLLSSQPTYRVIEELKS